MNGQGLLELIGIGLLIYGFCHEQQIAEWEQRTFKKLLIFLGKKDRIFKK